MGRETQKRKVESGDTCGPKPRDCDPWDITHHYFECNPKVGWCVVDSTTTLRYPYQHLAGRHPARIVPPAEIQHDLAWECVAGGLAALSLTINR